MGLLDKVKAQAEQAMTKAQQGMGQGQAKLDQMQAKRRSDALLRDLGMALYAEQRQGGDNQAVLDALAAVDGFVAAQGSIDLKPTAAAPVNSSDSTSSASPPAPEGDFTLDDA